MSGLKVRLFGKFIVEQDQEQVMGLDSHKVQELFSYILIHYDHPQSRESLSEVLWENQPPFKSKKNRSNVNCSSPVKSKAVWCRGYFRR